MSGRPLDKTDLFAYALLALPLAALNLPLNVYLPTFYAREYGLDLAAIGLIFGITRLFDIVTDPIVGEWQDRTRSRFGRRKPWIAAALPFLLFSSFLLYVPQNWFGGIGLVYVFCWLTAAYLAWTVMQLGYGAWGAELSSDYHERSKITGWREGFVIAGIICAAALPTIIGVDAGAPEALFALFLLVAIGVPFAAGILLVRIPDPMPATHHAMAWLDGLKAALANRPFRQLIAAYILNGLANGLPATLFLLFVEHRLGMPDSSGPFLLLYFVSGIAAVPLWLKLSYRIGKHRAWATSMLWACLIFASAMFVGPGDFWLFAAICLFSGASLGADLALPVSMQADVVDLDRARTGRQRTGLYFAAWSMATKLALALAVGIAFPLLQLAGFDAASQDNDAAGLVALTALYALAPVAFKLIAIALVWRFEIGAEAQKQIQQTFV